MALYYDEILAGNCLGQINIVPPPSMTKTTMKEASQSVSLLDQFGFSLEKLFYMARQFLKEKQGSSDVQLKYGDNIRLIALSKQAKIGKWDASHTQDVGFLDVVGNDRKQAWIALGNMSKEQAMEELQVTRQIRSVDELKMKENNVDRAAPRESAIIYLHLELICSKGHKASNDETRRELEEQAERVRQYELAHYSRLEKQQKKREDFQRKQIQDVLSQQTYSQFKAYAEQQYKDNKQAQEELIRQLQEQHFQQYMEQVYQQQLIDQQQQFQNKMNTEQQLPVENVIPSMGQSSSPLTPTNVEASPPPMAIIPPPATNIIPPPAMSPVSPPTSLNIVQPPQANIPTATSPTNAVSSPLVANLPSPSTIIPPPASNVPFQHMSPVGPVPHHLPPLAHPPPPIMPFQSPSTSQVAAQEIKLEPMPPIQTQFETLTLNTPLEPITHIPSQPSVGTELPHQQFPLTPINNESATIHSDAVDGQALTTPVVGANGELVLPAETENAEAPKLIPANMWTRKDLKEFKEQIRKEKDAVIKVGSGETVTVRVPTHEDGQCIFWEFATDYYDLGFGVYFEWSKSATNTVTVHVSDSSDEEENEDGANPEKKDIEKGSGSTNKPPKPPQDEIVPIYRRDCHEEVHAGSHSYPGQGVYLLKFDNSYSLWRSKTLYYHMNTCEQRGAEELLSMLTDDELMSVKDTVTKSMISTESRSEAIDACLKCSQSAMELLRRKKIRRDILMQYLAKKSIPVGPGTDKVKLVKQIIDFWNNGCQAIANNNSNNNNNSIVPANKLPGNSQLSHQFTEWFYTSWNSISTFTSDHFFPDCQLTLIHENNRRVLGSYYVCDILRAYVTNQELRFCPNPQSNKVEESQHGLVLIQIHGTIHQHGTCIGVFDQSFGLVRDPNHSNNYLIKFCFLNMQTQQAQQHPQLLSNAETTPNYLVDIMQNYDQTIQQQIDSTDYIIEDPDDGDDKD
ncbi:unnamed protein product [Adineta ricciae]|uniref:Golgi resident protein GCP60 n=1 Tax=Adineta ricciae TaxID=249248 RepID=A0A813ZUY8_ADIRI|nr:unnamed protein product [Adineta ricciae]